MLPEKRIQIYFLNNRRTFKKIIWEIMGLKKFKGITDIFITRFTVYFTLIYRRYLHDNSYDFIQFPNSKQRV